jgi:Holliday junction resolvase RusA-like endonuclease
MISIHFDHRPVPWSRVLRGERTKRAAKQRKYIEDLSLVMKLAAEGQSYDGPVSVRAQFDYKNNCTRIEVHDVSHRTDLKITRADADNLLKAVLESLQKSGIVKDDAQVAILEAEKLK